MNDFARQVEEFLSTASSKVYIAGFPPMDEGSAEALSIERLQLAFFGNPPVRLFHYYSDRETEMNGKTVNHSRDALRTGAIHLSSPTEFNDPFECTVPIDAEQLKLEAIRLFASVTGMAPIESDSLEMAADELLERQCSPDKCLLINDDDENMRSSACLFRSSMENSALRRNGMVEAGDVIAGAQAVVDCAVPSFDQFRIFASLNRFQTRSCGHTTRMATADSASSTTEAPRH